MITNIKKIAKLLEENSDAVNTPYTSDKGDFKVSFWGNGEIWFFVDTKWKKEYKRHLNRLKKVFHASHVSFEKNCEKGWDFWAIRLR